MSTFEVNVVLIDDIYDHPNADRLSIVLIGGYEAITMKDPETNQHRFFKGEPVVYVPEFAVVPEHLLKQYGFWNDEKNVGMLAGSKGNRVKAIRLRGNVSQGLVWKTRPHDDNFVIIDAGDKIAMTPIGSDCSEFFGIVKYEEPIPASMSGRVGSIPEAILHFDIENYQKFPNLLVEGEEVVATEKLHGTFCRVTYLPGLNNEKLFGGDVAVCSKGLGSKGLVFEDTEENRASNVYVQAAVELNIVENLRNVANTLYPDATSVSVMGEVFGKGVQDLTYGFEKKTFRVFAVNVDGEYLDEDTMVDFIEKMQLERVPVLYRGPFNVEKLTELRDGKTTYNSGFNIREGIVVTATGSQTKRKQGGYSLRPIVKMVSPDYLLRKGGTELQ